MTIPYRHESVYSLDNGTTGRDTRRNLVSGLSAAECETTHAGKEKIRHSGKRLTPIQQDN
jgi:hypothetical protein